MKSSENSNELFTNILHRLAPDDEITDWTNDSDLFSNGRPTRRARLLYICRKISHSPFDNFVDSDVSSTLKFIKIFQEGTHDIESNFTDDQLLALVNKTGSLITYLIGIGTRN